MHFYYELGKQWCYLVAEQMLSSLPLVPEWEPLVGVAGTPFTDLLLRAIALSLREPERLNAAFDQNALIIFAEINIAFAVAAGHHPVSARFGQKQTWDAA